MYKAVYNFLRMFKKDSGAHFTYNLGVGMIRLSLLFFLWALLIIGEWFFLSSPRFEVRENVKVRLLASYPVEDGYMAEFEVYRDNELGKTVAEYVTQGMLTSFRNDPYLIDDYVVYDLYGRGIDTGVYYGSFLSKGITKIAEWQYYLATPDARPPVQTWGIWLSLLISAVMFMIGRRQIRLSMKYPRSDVPVTVTGAPVIVHDTDSVWAMACERAREQMRIAARKRLGTGNFGEADTNNETAAP